MNNGFTQFPWPLTFFGQQPVERIVEQRPPQRVEVAMKFLYYLAGKTTDKAAPHNMGCETIAGQKAMPAETAAQTAACELLRNYFRGELKPDWYEVVAEEEKELLGKQGCPTPCLCCSEGAKANPNCPLCKGNGRIVIYPSDN